jgi:hypothetical protein
MHVRLVAWEINHLSLLLYCTANVVIVTLAIIYTQISAESESTIGNVKRSLFIKENILYRNRNFHPFNF